VASSASLERFQGSGVLPPPKRTARAFWDGYRRLSRLWT
jgi:hypothetical protein